MTQQKTKALNLRIPGPTPVPPDILAAVGRPMVNHRGKEFGGIVERISERLKDFFLTSQDVMVLSCSGTGGLEAAVVNTLSPGDKVLAVSIGAFGERFATIAETYAADVTMLPYEWGQPARADDVRHALKEDSQITAVLVTHNETSTGVTNALAQIAEVVREFDKLLLVDAVSSLGAIPLEMDAWGLDCVVTGSQKGWMVPPGLAFAALSERGWQAYETSKMPRFYFDLGQAKKYLERWQTPATPAVSLYYAFQAAFELLDREGMASVLARHQRCAERVRAGVRALGLELFADPAHASNTVTSVKPPEGVEVADLRMLLRESGVVVAGGQGALTGMIFRIGHLGMIAESDVDEILAALKQALSRLRAPVQA